MHTSFICLFLNTNTDIIIPPAPCSKRCLCWWGEKGFDIMGKVSTRWQMEQHALSREVLTCWTRRKNEHWTLVEHIYCWLECSREKVEKSKLSMSKWLPNDSNSGDIKGLCATGEQTSFPNTSKSKRKKHFEMQLTIVIIYAVFTRLQDYFRQISKKHNSNS